MTFEDGHIGPREEDTLRYRNAQLFSCLRLGNSHQVCTQGRFQLSIHC